VNRSSWVDRMLALETLAIYVFLWFPILVLVLFSFNSSRQVVVWESASLHWYRVLAKDATLIASLERSLWVAFLTTAIAVVIGTPAALALARWQFRGKGAFSRLVDLPLIVPEIVMASSMVIFFGFVGVRLSMTTVVIAHGSRASTNRSRKRRWTSARTRSPRSSA
jgi:spermidine/putrescine transport system permease protein